MLSAATTSACLPGLLAQRLDARRISGTPLAQPTPVMWYLSVARVHPVVVDEAVGERRDSRASTGSS